MLRPATQDLAALVGSGAIAPDAGADRSATSSPPGWRSWSRGGTGAGKTTLLSARWAPSRRTSASSASRTRPNSRRAHPHLVNLVARYANVEGVGEVTVRDLVRQALRMRPDRIVVGEVRGGEVVDLLAALNTGHDGGAGTVHANSPAEVPARLEALAALGGLDRAALHSQLAAAVRVVLHVGRDRAGVRRLDGDRGAGQGRRRTGAAATAWHADRGFGDGMDRLDGPGVGAAPT